MSPAEVPQVDGETVGRPASLPLLRRRTTAGLQYNLVVDNVKQLGGNPPANVLLQDRLEDASAAVELTPRQLHSGASASGGRLLPAVDHRKGGHHGGAMFLVGPTLRVQSVALCSGQRVSQECSGRLHKGKRGCPTDRIPRGDSLGNDGQDEFLRRVVCHGNVCILPSFHTSRTTFSTNV